MEAQFLILFLKIKKNDKKKAIGRRIEHLENELVKGVESSNTGTHIQQIMGGHGGRLVTLSPLTSEAGVRFPAWPQVGKAGSCLPLVSSLQYRTLMNCMYLFPLPFQLPVVI